MPLIRLSLDYALVDERIEPAGQKIARYAEVLDQIVEPRDVEKKVSQDQWRPPVTDHLEAARQRTVHLRKTGSLHDTDILSCLIELNGLP